MSLIEWVVVAGGVAAGLEAIRRLAKFVISGMRTANKVWSLLEYELNNNGGGSLKDKVERSLQQTKALQAQLADAVHIQELFRHESRDQFGSVKRDLESFRTAMKAEHTERAHDKRIWASVLRQQGLVVPDDDTKD